MRPNSRKLFESALGEKDWGYEGVILHLYWHLDLINYANSHKNIDKMCFNDQRIHLVHVILAAKTKVEWVYYNKLCSIVCLQLPISLSSKTPRNVSQGGLKKEIEGKEEEEKIGFH